MTEEEELAALTAQKEALQAELAAIQNSISTLQTTGG
jgi:prefoldin subunit 5